MSAFQAYDWPGNVRELANVLEGAVSLLPDGQHTLTRVPPVIERALRERGTSAAAETSRVFLPTGQVVPFDEVERGAFEHALRHCGGNVAQAAKALGVAKGTFYSKIRRYGLKVSEQVPPGVQDDGIDEPLSEPARMVPSRKTWSPSV
jgi:transcriptional regulator of acetoin/glycerol metabolism